MTIVGRVSLIARGRKGHRLIGLCIAFAFLLWLSTSVLVPTSRAGWLAPHESLKPDGTLNLSLGKTGTMGVQGWTVQLDPQRGPRFVPSSPDSDTWFPQGYGLTHEVYAIALSGNKAYVGGEFYGICGNVGCNPEQLQANNIAVWNGNTWSSLGYGLSGRVLDLAVVGNDVYAVGFFEFVCGNKECNSGNVRVNRIAKWNGSNWSALGNGVDKGVHAIAVSGTDVYVGGSFSKLCGGNVGCKDGSVKANFVAKWNGSSWSSLGHGVKNSVNAIEISGTDVYVGGSFEEVCGNEACNVGNLKANHIAKWDGSSWSSLGYGPARDVFTIAVSGSEVYVGGPFEYLCGSEACNSDNLRVNRIAKWNGTSWSALGYGLGHYPNSIVVRGAEVYAGGAFKEACGTEACDIDHKIVNFIAKWNGNSWSPLSYGFDAHVNALALGNGLVYAGGAFMYTCGNEECNSGNIKVNRIAGYSSPSLCFAKPAKPTLRAPGVGATSAKRKVKLKWSDVLCETEYKLEVRNASTHAKAFTADLDSDITTQRTTELAKGATYIWFVRACNTFGCSKSQKRTFALLP